MAKFGSGKKPANQGSIGSPNIQKPKTSGTPSQKAAPRAEQTARRGVHTPGNRGTRKP